MFAGECQTWFSIRFPVNFLIWVLLCPSDMFIGYDWLPEYERNGTLDCCARSVYSESSWTECSRKLTGRSLWKVQKSNKNSMKTFYCIRIPSNLLHCRKSTLNDSLLSRIQTENCNSAWFMWYPLWLHNWSGSNNNRMPRLSLSDCYREHFPIVFLWLPLERNARPKSLLANFTTGICFTNFSFSQRYTACGWFCRLPRLLVSQ